MASVTKELSCFYLLYLIIFIKHVASSYHIGLHSSRVMLRTHFLLSLFNNSFKLPTSLYIITQKEQKSLVKSIDLGSDPNSSQSDFEHI